MTFRKRRQPTPNFRMPPPFQPISGQQAPLKASGLWPYCVLMQVAKADIHENYCICRGFDTRMNKFVDYEQGNADKPGIPVAKPYSCRMTGLYEQWQIYAALLPIQSSDSAGDVSSSVYRVPPSPITAPIRLGQNPGKATISQGHPQYINEEVVLLRTAEGQAVNWMFLECPDDQSPGGGIFSRCVPACECCAIGTPGKLFLTLTGFTCCTELNDQHELCWHPDGGCRWYKCVSGFCLVEDPEVCDCDTIIPVDLYINAVMPPPDTGCFCETLVVTVTLSAPRFSAVGCLTANRTILAARFIFDLPGASQTEPDCCAAIPDAVGCYIGINCNGVITGHMETECDEPAGSVVNCGCDHLKHYWEDGINGIHLGRLRFTFSGSATGYVILSPTSPEGVCYRWEYLVDDGYACDIPANCALIHCGMTFTLTCPDCDLATMADIVATITGAGSETCGRSALTQTDATCSSSGIYLRYAMTLVDAEPAGCAPCFEGDPLILEVTNEDPPVAATCGCEDEIPDHWVIGLSGFLAGDYDVNPVSACDCLWRSAWFTNQVGTCPAEWQLCLSTISLGTEITYKLELRDRTATILRVWHVSYGTSLICCDVVNDPFVLQTSENMGDCDQDFTALAPTLTAVCVGGSAAISGPGTFGAPGVVPGAFTS